MEWSKIFFVRILLFFITGIVIGNICINLPIPTWLLLGVPLLFLFKLILIQNLKARTKKYYLKDLESIIIFLFLFSFGFCSYNLRYPGKSLTHFSHKEFDYIEVELTESLKPATNSQKGKLQVQEVSSTDSRKKAEGNILGYFPRNSQIPAGTILLIKNQAVKTKPPLNPYQFNYADYLKIRGVTHTVFLNENQYIILDYPKWYNPYFIAENLKNSIHQIFENYIPVEKHRAIISGLLLGDKSEMSDELTKKFSLSGLSHILAVSGFHTALIYQLLVWLLGTLQKLKNGNIIFTLTVIAMLWIYAFLSGLPPSVIRAALMLSLYLTGKLINRKQNGLHILTLTAFILLLINPLYLFDLGFQLSFSAVLGILMAYKPLSRLVKTDSFILKKTWEIVCISISAQLLTFPLVGYYFHSLPLYFILSNLLSTLPVIILIYSTLLLLIFSWLSPIAKILGIFISKVSDLLELIVNTISLLPGLDGKFYFSNLFLAGWIIFVLLAYSAIIYRSIRLSYTAFAILFILCISNIRQINQRASQKIFSVFHIPGQSAIAIIQGFTASIYTDIDKPKENKKIQYALNGFLGQHLVDSISYLALSQPVDLRIFDKSIKIRSSPSLKELDFDCDYLILKNYQYQIPYRKDKGHRKIIFDGSNNIYSYYDVNLNAHFTYKSGAYIEFITP